MEEKEVVKLDKTGKHLIKYEDSPLMSTYLLAYVVGEFDYVEGKTNEGVVVRVFTLLEEKKKVILLCQWQQE